MKLLPVDNSSVSCKARLTKQTLGALSKEYEPTKVEDACLGMLLKQLDKKGKPTTRINIGEYSKEMATRVVSVVNAAGERISELIPIPHYVNSQSLIDTVRWLCNSDMVNILEQNANRALVAPVKIGNTVQANKNPFLNGSRRGRILQYYS